MRIRAAFFLLFLAVLAARLCHLDILWVEECYPAAGAIQILHGRIPYRDFWFDKPPLSAVLYLLWGGWGGWPLRLAGALYVTLVAWLLYRFARSMWGANEAALAAGLGAFYLTFGIPSAVVALAPDLLMAAPHIAAVYLAWRRRPLLAGLAAGVAMLVNVKGALVLAACLLWRPGAAGPMLAGFALPNMAAAGWLAAQGAWGGYVEQVWRWGRLYSQDTFVAAPALEGLRRGLNWAGFHAALVAGALFYWRREKEPGKLRFALWLLVSLAGVAAGWRFFPRYFFQLLPVLILLAARGLSLAGRRRAIAALALLLVPLVRFGPRYAVLAADLAAGRGHRWSDLAMFEGSREAARQIASLATPGDTLLVWGYRPDVFVLTRMPAGSRFIDSQPLTGVIADRHLADPRPSAPGLARRNRGELARARPHFIVDGLGPYNPALSVRAYPDLAPWLAGYEEVIRLRTAVVYRTRRSRAGARPFGAILKGKESDLPVSRWLGKRN